MSSIAAQIPPDEPVFRLTVKQYHAMIDAGVLTDDDPVELLEGILVFKMPKKPAHRLALRKLAKALEKLLSSDYFVQLQEPITLNDGEPEPDAAVIHGTDEDYATRHPGPRDVPMVVEVSDTTLARDRGIKLRSYAGAGIQIYWIVDLISRRIEVYTGAKSTSDASCYEHRNTFENDTCVPVMIGDQKLGEIAVSAILP